MFYEKVLSSQLKGFPERFVDDVIEFISIISFPVYGKTERQQIESLYKEIISYKDTTIYKNINFVIKIIEKNYELYEKVCCNKKLQQKELELV